MPPGVMLQGEVNEGERWDEVLHAFVRLLGAQFVARHVQDGHED